MREYELRRGDGYVSRRGRFENACTAILSWFLRQGVSMISDAEHAALEPRQQWNVYVCATGEKIDYQRSGDKMRLADHDVWYDVNGKQVPPP